MEKFIFFVLLLGGAIWFFSGSGEQAPAEQPVAAAVVPAEVASDAVSTSTSTASGLLETLATWFAYGTIGFFAVILLMIVVIGILQEQRETYPGWCSVILTFGLVLLFAGNPGWWTGMIESWYVTVPVVACLLLTFALWAFFKWKINAWRFWHLMEGYYVVYCRENNLLTNLSVPVSLSSSHRESFLEDWDYYAHSKRMNPRVPTYEDYRGRMVYWACFAPFSMLATMAQDGIGQIFSKMLDARRKSFDRRSEASREGLKGLFEDDAPSVAGGDDTARA